MDVDHEQIIEIFSLIKVFNSHIFCKSKYAFKKDDLFSYKEKDLMLFKINVTLYVPKINKAFLLSTEKKYENYSVHLLASSRILKFITYSIISGHTKENLILETFSFILLTYCFVSLMIILNSF